MKDNNFSFVKLRDEIINKSGIGHLHNLKDSQRKLKFEPNVNISRQNIPHTEFKTEKPEQTEPSNVVNLTESKFCLMNSLFKVFE
jgi:hypothetical protein